MCDMCWHLPPSVPCPRCTCDDSSIPVGLVDAWVSRAVILTPQTPTGLERENEALRHKVRRMIIMTECARKTSSTVSSNAIERSVKLENENLALHDQVMKMLKALSMAKKRMENMVDLENENAALRRELDATKRMSSLATVEMVLRSAALQKENEVLRKRMVEMETLFGKGGGHASPHRSRSVSPASETLW